MTQKSVNSSNSFISEYKSLSLDQLKHILNQKKKVIKDNYKELSEKEKIIRDIRKVDKLNEKIKKALTSKKNGKRNQDPKRYHQPKR